MTGKQCRQIYNNGDTRIDTVNTSNGESRLIKSSRLRIPEGATIPLSTFIYMRPLNNFDIDTLRKWRRSRQ